MLDRKQIKIQEQVERPVAAGALIPNEGVILCEAIEAGVSKVFVQAVVTGREKVAGVALLPYMLPSKAVSNEQFVVPASGSLIFNLRNTNLDTLSSRAMVVGGVDLVPDETAFTAVPPTGTVKIDIVGGRIKFAAGDAGKVVDFLYRYSLTVTMARIRYQERSINNRDLVGEFAQVGVAKAYVEIATDQFNTLVDWTDPATVLYLGNNGIITNAGPGPVIPQGKVLAAPDLSGSLQGAMLRFSALIG